MKKSYNYFSIAAIVCVVVLLVCSILGMAGIMTVGSGAAIFVIAVGFNGVICATLSYHLSPRVK